MLQKIVDYFSRKEFVSHAARCTVALAAVVWIHPYVQKNKKIIRETDAHISLRIANFVILQSLFTGNIFLGGQLKRSICWLGLKELEQQIDPLQKGSPFANVFSEAKKKVKALTDPLISRTPFPWTTGLEGKYLYWWKAMVRAFAMELIFRGVFQEVLLRQIPKYLFAASRVISPKWVDSRIFQIARIFLSSLIYGLFRSRSNNQLIKETISGAFSGYLAETGGLSFSIIQRFSEYFYEDVKSSPLFAGAAKVHYLPGRTTASCMF